MATVTYNPNKKTPTTPQDGRYRTSGVVRYEPDYKNYSMGAALKRDIFDPLKRVFTGQNNTNQQRAAHYRQYGPQAQPVLSMQPYNYQNISVNPMNSGNPAAVRNGALTLNTASQFQGPLYNTPGASKSPTRYSAVPDQWATRPQITPKTANGVDTRNLPDWVLAKEQQDRVKAQQMPYIADTELKWFMRPELYPKQSTPVQDPGYGGYGYGDWGGYGGGGGGGGGGYQYKPEWVEALTNWRW